MYISIYRLSSHSTFPFAPKKEYIASTLHFSYPGENSPLVIRAGAYRLYNVLKNVLIHTLMGLRRKEDSRDSKTKGLSPDHKGKDSTRCNAA